VITANLVFIRTPPHDAVNIKVNRTKARAMEQDQFGCPTCWPDDAQYWTVMPVTIPEAAELIKRKKANEFSEEMLTVLGKDRRSLFRDWPTGKPSPRAHWASGILIGPHD
jgi:hypothetical protein